MPVIQRILYFSTQFPNPRSPGMGIFSLRRVQALQQAGCQVRVISPLLMNPPPGLLCKPAQASKWFRLQSEVPQKMEYQGVPVAYPRWFCPPKKVFGWRMSGAMFGQVRKTVLDLDESFHPDVIISSWLPDAVAAVKLANILKIPILSIADGTDVNVWTKEYPGWKSARDILNEKVSKLIFVSEALRRAGASMGLHGRKNAVLHNAVDVHLFMPSPIKRENKPFTILSVGRLVPMKGFHILLSAVAQLNQSLAQPAHLILVGDGPQKEELLQKAEVLGLRDKLKIVAPMPQEQLVAFYQQADMFCLSSFSEGLPCVVVEAMACGKPVVASDVGGIGEVVDASSGILVSPGDAGALSTLLLQAKERAWQSEVIRQRIVEHYSWEIWTKNMLAMLDSIVV